jgi:hypothetical protein
MIRRQTFSQTVPLIVIAGLLLVAATTAVELRAGAHALPPLGWIASGATHAVVAAPASRTAAPATSSVTRSISRGPILAPATRVPAANSEIGIRGLQPIVGSDCPKAGVERSCTVP